MRGIRLYNSVLFEDEYPQQEQPSAKPIGRNPQLIIQRDDFLCHRFFFKTKIQRKIYLDALEELSRETWLSSFHIQKLLQANSDAVLLIKKQAPTIKALREKWPHIIWEL